MFLQQLPDGLRWLVLFVVGASLGGLINLAIYRLARYVNRNVSPWSAAPAADRKRSALDYIPVIGWLFLRRESDVYGKWHWVRPMLIEISSGVFLAWFFHWQMNGGLFGGPATKIVADQAELVGHWTFGWFLFHGVLFALMMAATFIDFDEQMIPDWITIPGTLFALICHTLSPDLLLPVKTAALLRTQLDPLDFWSPNAAVDWHLGVYGILVALLIILIWCFALIPKLATLRKGFTRGVTLMIASVRRPARKTTGTVPRSKTRKMFVETKVLFVLAILLSLVVVVLYLAGDERRWTALFDSLLGLAMGGGIVWSVRIIAGKALGVEAMGFGDVTLMCMIGAFVGWQPALLAFVIAPFTSMAVVLIQMLLTGDNRLAFGPYLCLGTTIVLIGWDWIWNSWASDAIFAVGGKFLMLMMLACMLLGAVILAIWGKFKYRDINE